VTRRGPRPDPGTRPDTNTDAAKRPTEDSKLAARRMRVAIDSDPAGLWAVVAWVPVGGAT
jgi:hypothetical protein